MPVVNRVENQETTTVLIGINPKGQIWILQRNSTMYRVPLLANHVRETTNIQLAFVHIVTATEMVSMSNNMRVVARRRNIRNKKPRWRLRPPPGGQSRWRLWQPPDGRSRCRWRCCCQPPPDGHWQCQPSPSKRKHVHLTTNYGNHMQLRYMRQEQTSNRKN